MDFNYCACTLLQKNYIHKRNSAGTGTQDSTPKISKCYCQGLTHTKTKTNKKQELQRKTLQTIFKAVKEISLQSLLNSGIKFKDGYTVPVGNLAF